MKSIQIWNFTIMTIISIINNWNNCWNFTIHILKYCLNFISSRDKYSNRVENSPFSFLVKLFHEPKIFSFYFGLHILHFLLLHIKVLRKQPDPLWNSWLLLLHATPHHAVCQEKFLMCPQRNAMQRIGVSRPLGLILSWYLCLSGSMIERQCIKLEIWVQIPA